MPTHADSLTSSLTGRWGSRAGISPVAALMLLSLCLLAGCCGHAAGAAADLPPQPAPAAAADLDTLIRQLGDPAAETRQHALAALRQCGAGSLAVHGPQLARMVAGGSWFEQEGAAQLLQGLGPQAAAVAPQLLAAAQTALASHDWAVLQVTMDALVAIAPATAAQLGPQVAALYRADAPSVRFNLVVIAGHLGPAARPLLPDLIQACSDPVLSVYALMDVVQAGGVTASRPLIEQALAAPDDQHALLAVRAAAALGADGAVLVPALATAIARPGLLEPGIDCLLAISPQAGMAAIPTLLKMAVTAPPGLHDQIALQLRRVKVGDQPPVAHDSTVSCIEGGSVTVALPVSDPDDLPDALTTSIVTPPAHGTVTSASLLSLTYTNILGSPATDRVVWKASDGVRESPAATLTIAIGPDTRPPQLLSAERTSPTSIELVFDKALDQRQAVLSGNYALDHGASVTAAAPIDSGLAVMLTTSQLDPMIGYQLQLKGLQDRCRVPNPLLPVTVTVAPFIHGLRGEYFSELELRGAATGKLDTQINFPAGPRPNHENYSVRWLGYLEPEHSETYTIYTTSDDGSRVFIDGVLVVNNWHDQAPTEASGTVALTAFHRHELRVEFYQGGGGQMMTMSWSSPSTPKAIIPADALWCAP